MMTEKEIVDLFLRAAEEKDAKKLYDILRQINADFARREIQEHEAELTCNSRAMSSKGMDEGNGINRI